MKKIKGLIKEIFHNAFGIFKRDIKDVLHNPVALIVVLGLIILPSLYAWVNIVACWDPYGNTAGIKVAVVNLDQGVELGEEMVNAGDKIIENLRENHSIGWQFVDSDDAEYGVTHGRYYAMLEIPENFSAQLVDVLDGNLKKPEIIYRVNEKSNAIAPKITDTGAKTVTNQVTQAIIEVVDEAAFSVGNEVGDTMGSNRNKITRLRDAVIAVNANFSELEAGLDDAQAGLITVNELLQDVSDSLPEVRSGVANLEDLSAQGNALLDEAEALKVQSVDYLDDKFDEILDLNRELQDFAKEAEGMTGDVSKIQDKIPDIQKTAGKLQKALEEFITILKRYEDKSPDYAEIIAKLEKADGALNQLQTALEQLTPAQAKQVLRTVYSLNGRVIDEAIQANETAYKVAGEDLKEEGKVQAFVKDVQATAEQGLAGSLVGQDLVSELEQERAKALAYNKLYTDLTSFEKMAADMEKAIAAADPAAAELTSDLQAIQKDCEPVQTELVKQRESTEVNYKERKTALDKQKEENAAKLTHVGEMSDEEIMVEIAGIQTDLDDMQSMVREAEEVVKKLDEKDISIATIVSELRHIDNEITDARSMLDRLDRTMTDGLSLADNAIALIQTTGADVDKAVADLRGAYNERWNGAVEGMLGDLKGSLGNLDAVLANANDALPKLDDLMVKGNDASAKSQELLDKVNAELPEARANIAKASEAMSKLSDENLSFLIEILGSDANEMSDYFSSPVQLTEERMYHIDNYGSAMTPFYTVLALWVGCLLLSAMLSVEAEPLVEGKKLRLVEVYFGKMMTFMLLTMLQSLVVALGDKYVLGIMVTNLPLFLISCLFTSFIFTLIVYTLVSLLETIGKAICVVFLVLQLAGAGGTFPVEVMPQFYQIMQPYLPFTYAIGALREAVAGPLWDNVAHDYIVLLGFGLLFLIIGLLLKKPLHPLISWFMKKFKSSSISE